MQPQTDAAPPIVGEIQNLLAQQHGLIQRVLTANFEMAARLSETAAFSTVGQAQKQEQQQQDEVDQQKQRLRDAETAADLARTEAEAQRQVNRRLHAEICLLRNDLALQKVATANEGNSDKLAGNVAPTLRFELKSSRHASLEPTEPGYSARSETTEPLLLQEHTAAFQEPPRRVPPRFRGPTDAGDVGPAVSHKRMSSKHKATLFPDADALKQQVRDSLSKQESTVEEQYKTTGCAQAVARHHIFKESAFCVIALNTLWIAVDTDYNKADVLCNAPLPFQIVENLFCIFFTFEIAVRLSAFEVKLNAFRDGWFVFDSILVALMAWETWVTPALYMALTSGTTEQHDEQGGDGGQSRASSMFRLLRLFRLTRVARLARLLNGLPELMVLIRGMVLAVRSVFSTLVLLVLFIFLFAILFTQLLSGTEVGAGCFDTVPQSMNCLLLSGVFPDQEDFINRLSQEHWIYYIIILVYMVVGSLTVMNMLIAVICEVVSVVAQVEKEAATVRDVTERLSQLLPDLDADGDRMVSEHEFRKMVNNPEAVRTLNDVKVDCYALVECADIIFKDTQRIYFEDFVEEVLKFRESNQATVKDLFYIKQKIAVELEGFSHHMKRIMTTSRL